MAFKVYVSDSGNYFYIEDLESGKLHEGFAKDVLVTTKDTANETFSFKNVNNFDNKIVAIADLQKKDGTAYTKAEFIEFYESSTGKSSAGDTAYTYPSWYHGKKIPVTYTDKEVFVNYDVKNDNPVLKLTKYYVHPTGLTSNDGLTRSTPFASVQGAIANGARNIILLAGLYNKSQSETGFVHNDLAITAEGKVYITQHTVYTWTENAGIYEADTSDIQLIVDKSVIENTHFKMYDYKESVAEVQAETGTWHNDGAKTYVNPINTTDDLITNNKQSQALYFAGSHQVYLGGINFICGLSTRNLDGDNYTPHLYMDECTFDYPNSSNPNESHSNSFLARSVYTIQQKMKVKDAVLDCVNPHNDEGSVGIPDFCQVEIECDYSNPDYFRDGSTNQASTAHDGANVLRINGKYSGGTNVIKDIQDSKTIMLGCEITQPKNRATDESLISLCTAHLLNCTLNGSPIGELSIEASEVGKTVTLENCKSSHTQLIEAGDIVIE